MLSPRRRRAASVDSEDSEAAIRTMILTRADGLAQMEAAQRCKCIIHFVHDFPISCFTTYTTSAIQGAALYVMAPCLHYPRR